jgi:hypothetical protein
MLVSNEPSAGLVVGSDSVTIAFSKLAFRIIAVRRKPSGFRGVEEPERLHPFRYELVCKWILTMH